MECVAYLRVSTEKQAEEGMGLDSQKRDIISYAGKNEFVIKDWYIDDGYTGSNMQRPALQRLINDCYSKKIKNVIAFKLDRLSRSMIDGLYIIEKIFIPNGVNFKCVHDTVSYDSPMEQAYTQMMAVFAQLDKNTMLLRMRGGMLERVKQGFWMGGGNTPYCYNYSKESGVLVQIPEKVAQVRTAMTLFLDGWSDSKIRDMLGFKSEFIVRQNLTSVVNAGKIPYKGNIYDGKHEPVFSEKEFELLQKVRGERRKKKHIKFNTNLLTGLCYCGVCGCAMRYQKWANKGHRLYCCSRDKSMRYLPNYNENCNNELFWAKDIEKEVEDRILEISLNITKDDFFKSDDKLALLNKQLDTVKGKLKRLYGIYAEGNDTVVEIISDLEKEVSTLKDAIINEEEKSNNYSSRETQYKKIKKIADVWQDIDKEDKNKILKSIIDKIIIVNGDIEIVLRDF